MKKQKIFLVIIILFSSISLLGCNRNNKNYDIGMLREAIRNQEYEEAKRYVETVLKKESNNSEARVILNYIKYEDDMLLATFWDDDIDAMKYIAPIIYDINRNDLRFEAPVLVLAAAWGKTDMVKILLEAGADPNYGADKNGLTALMWASKSFESQLEMVKMLLEAGADIHAQSNYNETPLSIAKEYMNVEVISIIKEYSNDY